MRIVGREALEEFCSIHVDARRWIELWLQEVENAHWRSPQEIKDRYKSASFLADNIVIFNVKGNNYRMEVAVAYKTGTVVIRWIGTHREYDVRNRNR